MPTYEYQCRSCNHRLEKLQGFNDEPLRECPSCGGELRRVIHAVGIIFKGSGFYCTDSRKSSTLAPTESTKEPAATSSSPEKEKVAASTDS